MRKNIVIAALIIFAGISGIYFWKSRTMIPTSNPEVFPPSILPTGWDPNLTADQYAVLHDKGTETPFTSPLIHEKRAGTYVTADCGEPVFRSEQKYDSGTGWPSFWAPINDDALVLEDDTMLLLPRTEVLSKCGGHLGHVFDDGPAPTGKRYCMNGLALKFIPDEVATTTP